MPDSDSTTRAAYDRIASQFSRRNAVMPAEIAEKAGRLLEHALPGTRILDLGCGAGRDLAWMQAANQGARRLFGADLSRGMLLEARQITSVPLCQMDMLSLGFADESFGGVWCIAALLHLPKRLAPAALAEISRVLVPGGRLTISMQEGEGEGIERGAYDDPGLERFFARYTAPEFSGLLANAGFHILRQSQNLSHRRWLSFEAAKRSR